MPEQWVERMADRFLDELFDSEDAFPNVEPGEQIPQPKVVEVWDQVNEAMWQRLNAMAELQKEEG